MKNGLFKVICVTSVLAMLVAFGSPQLGKRKGTTGGGGGTTTTGGGGGGGGNNTGGGGGSSSGGGGGGGNRREDPPRRTTGGGGGSTTTTGGGNATTGGGGGGGFTTGGGGGGGSSSNGGGGGGIGRRTGGDQGGGGGTIISGERDRNNGDQGGRFGGDLGRRRQGGSRSGNVQYGTESNGAGRITVNGLRIDRPPTYINGGMQRRVGDQERVSLVYDGWRVGYYHYNRRWNDDQFCYPYYVFNPWQPSRYVCSPWYYYPSCPPYLNSTRIVIINSGWPSYNWTGDAYRWNRRDDRNDRRWDDRDRSEIDYAVDDLVDAWERFDTRAMNRIIPRRGNVNMYFDGHYSYSLSPDDFYDLFSDGIENVDTRRYDIEDVRYSRNGGVRIIAKHEYIDPWNRRSYAYHMYFLEQEGRGYVIREFGTSNYRTAW